MKRRFWNLSVTASIIFIIATLLGPLFRPIWVEAQVGVLRAARALLADGTSSAPAYSWANDTDLGRWRIGPDEEGHAGSLAIKGPRPWVDVLAKGADETGVADSLAAINEAIDDAALIKGRVIMPPGTYKTSGMIQMKQGVILEGSSRQGTIIKPDATVSVAMTIAPYAGVAFPTDHVISGIRIDMVNMPNASTTFGLRMLDSWANRISDFDVINEPALSDSVRIDAGVFTTVFTNAEFRRLRVTKLGGTLATPTTLTFISVDIESAVLAAGLSMTFIQPVIQGTLDKFVLSDVEHLQIIGGDMEGSGVYLNVGASVKGVYSIGNTVQLASYKTGTIAPPYLLADKLIAGVRGWEISEPIVAKTGTTASLAQNATETILTATEGQTWQIFATGGGLATWRMLGYAVNEDTTQIHHAFNSNIEIVASGEDIQLKNINATSIALTWSAKRLK